MGDSATMSETTAGEATASSGPEPTGDVTASLEAEIAAGVEAAISESAPPPVASDDGGGHVAENERDVKPVDEGVDESNEEDDPPASTQAGVSDEVIERAVRAGIPISEAKQYSDDALLSAMCARIEGAGEKPGEGADHGGEEGPADVEDLLSAIPDLSPEEYDEQLVSGFKSLKEIIRRQSEEIAGLRGGRSRDWIDTQLEGVKDFTKGDAEKTASVREKYDVLSAGYKAAGKNVTDEAVFSEAVKLALGGEMEAARLSKKGKAARRRSGQHIQRPSGNRAQAKPDAESSIAAELDLKFFS